MTTTVLDEITAHKREEVKALKQAIPFSALQSVIQDAQPTRGFAKALAARDIAVIAEIKKASPSKGVIREDFDPPAIAKSYEQHGAACLSVLTDERFFQGSNRALQSAREEVRVPILRKDFIVDAYQIEESRAIGADCLLLIVATLDQPQLQDFFSHAKELALDVLVEVHNEAELEKALAIEADLIGINNRNLRTFETDLAVTERLVKRLPDGIQVVSESGIHTSQDVRTVVCMWRECFSCRRGVYAILRSWNGIARKSSASNNQLPQVNEHEQACTLKSLGATPCAFQRVPTVVFRLKWTVHLI